MTVNLLAILRCSGIATEKAENYPIWASCQSIYLIMHILCLTSQSVVDQCWLLHLALSLEMEFASLEENKMQLNLRQQLQNKTWSIAELYQLQEGCRVVRTAVSPPANRAILHWCSSSCRGIKPWTAELHHLQERSCKVVITAASPPANRVMLHIEAAAIAEKQNFDCRVNSNHKRERERERERCKWVAEQHFHQMCMLHTQIGQCKKWLQQSAQPMLLGWTWWHMPMHC